MPTPPSPRFTRRLAPVALVALAACASRAAPLDLPPGHPANVAAPAAPEHAGVDPAVPAGPAALDRTMSHAHARYTCPMHPDVRSSEPGSCPKCGMRLVAVKDEAEAKPPQGEHR